ncbi:MAG: roadblock/LC7 domain-containing protein [Candidatus Coatesbacteria bacterium]|nr:MAG: roadblock/LC7 domain-containing protein [Candidatus Coatesbacteria bacterium]
MTKIYREMLFSRALDRLTTQGTFREAYLVSRAGLVWAQTAGADNQEGFAALTSVAAAAFERAAAAGFKPLTLRMELDDGTTVVFYRFQHAGESAEEFFVAAVAEAPGAEEVALIVWVAEEIKEDLKLFY